MGKIERKYENIEYTIKLIRMMTGLKKGNHVKRSSKNLEFLQ
jgi:hypothetical protein